MNLAHVLYAGLGTTFMLQPADNTTVIGEIALLDCSSPPSIPSAVISWSRNFAQLNSPRYQVLQNGSLMISDVELGDHASYTCTATNPLLGASRTSRGATLTVIGMREWLAEEYVYSLAELHNNFLAVFSL